MGFPKRYLEATDVKPLSKTPVRGQEVEEYRWLPIVKNSFSKSCFSGDSGIATMRQGSDRASQQGFMLLAFMISLQQVKC